MSERPLIAIECDLETNARGRRYAKCYEKYFDAVVAAACETLGPGTRVQWIPGTDLAAAGALVADLAPSFVVWPSGNRPMSEQEADWLLRTARTPLLLMR